MHGGGGGVGRSTSMLVQNTYVGVTEASVCDAGLTGQPEGQPEGERHSGGTTGLAKSS